MKVRILGNIKYQGNILEQYEVYDVDPVSAKRLIEKGKAKAVEASYPHVQAINPKKRGSKPGELVDAVENKQETTVQGVEPAKQEEEVRGDDKVDPDVDDQGEAEEAAGEETAQPTSDEGEKGGA